MARLLNLMKTISENKLTHNVVCANCGHIEYGPTDKFGAEDTIDTYKEDEKTCSECDNSEFKISAVTNESETTASISVEALETLIEMVKNDALNDAETAELVESIEAIFNNILVESEHYDSEFEDEVEEYEDEESEVCCDWTGTEDELDTDEETEEFMCPSCGSSVSEYEDEESGETMFSCNDDFCESEEEDEESEEDEYMEEGAMLNKSTMAEKKAAKMYARSAAGKKTLKLVAKKRNKYATQIEKCAGKGKTFSFKKMTCVTSKKQR